MGRRGAHPRGEPVHNYESELLDGWRLDEWLALFTPDCVYLVPSTDRPDGDPETDLFFVRDDWFLLSQRVATIMDGTAWTESPRSITKRIISNVRAAPVAGSEGEIAVRVEGSKGAPGCARGHLR